MTLRPHRVHVLLGENGAGKSTLVNILIGALAPDSGSIHIDNEVVSTLTTAQAKRFGISAVLQDLSLAPSLSVLDNLFLGRELRKYGVVRDVSGMRREGQALSKQLKIKLALDTRVDDLGVGERQLVEIAKAVMGNRGVILFDEPTASLSQGEASHLFETIRGLRDKGWAVLYITHRLDEIRAIGDEVTVLRDGEVTWHGDISAIQDRLLIKAMIGKDLERLYPVMPKQPPDVATPALVATGINSVDGKVRNCSIKVYAGEIVGLAGLVGCGKSELLATVFGTRAGTVRQVEVNGEPVKRITARTMLRNGVVRVPGDRHAEGLALGLSVETNVNMEVFASSPYVTRGVLRREKLKANAEQLMDRLDIVPRKSWQKTGALSGGNQQKVVFCRTLTRPRRVFLLDEPTVGVDVGARERIYDLMLKLVESGAAIVMASSDLEEIVHMCHRVYVMREGRIELEIEGEAINEEAILNSAFGGDAEADSGVLEPMGSVCE